MSKLFKQVCFIITVVFVLCFNFIFCSSVSRYAYGELRYSAYGGALYATDTQTETINYTKREVTFIQTVNAVPQYEQMSDLPNSCGATAGAIIVGFYDKYFEELIPGYVTYLPNGRYKSMDSTYIPNLMSSLYTLMRTNVDAEGVNEQDCVNGLKNYVNNCGRTISYTSISASKIINETALIDSIDGNTPVLLFCGKMDLYNISTTTTYDTVTCTELTGAHVAVGYGYYKVDYYNGNSIFRTDKYIRISTGLPILTDGYLKISSLDWCNGAYSVKIS